MTLLYGASVLSMQYLDSMIIPLIVGEECSLFTYVGVTWLSTIVQLAVTEPFETVRRRVQVATAASMHTIVKVNPHGKAKDTMEMIKSAARNGRFSDNLSWSSLFPTFTSRFILLSLSTLLRFVTLIDGGVEEF
jgi:hypothetical protein